MTINLDENQIQEVKETYEKLKNIYENKSQMEILKKERENTIKEGIASICDLRDKEGNTDIKKVKMPLLIALLNEIYNEKENPKETEYSLASSSKALQVSLSNKDTSANTPFISSFVAFISSSQCR